MTINALTIYLVSMADNILGLFVGILITAGLAFAVAGVCWVYAIDGYDDDDSKKVFKVLKYTLPFVVVSTLGVAFTPSSKTLAAMIVIPAVVNNEKVQGIAENSLTALQNLTEQWVKQTTQSKEK